ncbi:MAG: ParB/RepB/Spo0J family partition protein [Pseudomonadota bacterium]|nr:ParB/RepB/Spo0J family partition protein [Pseudomonadota bacterium]MDE3036977.1 ParB/RepB/Spo0J family partition protein [Pseudomonadota bacterium]
MATITQRGLGKGLSALISENYVQPAAPKSGDAATASGVYTLALSKLHSGAYQPRTQFSDAALSELAESIRANGVMQPIIVRPSARQKDKYEIVAGERRWRAAQLAALEEIPVIIREIPDKQALELALVENVQRQDLSPLEEAGGYQRLIEEFSYTQEELATTIGKSRSHVANLLRLLSLPEEVKALLDGGQLTMGHARALIGAPNSVELAREIVRKGFNVRQAEELGRVAQGHEKRTSPRERSGGSAREGAPKDPDILALEATLSENLGLKVSINDRGQSGEIVIAYDSLAQLDDILKRLGDGI